MNRLAVALVTVASVSTAHAGVEVGGTAGLHVFSETNALGTKDNDPTHQANSALFGLRVGVYFSSMLGVELEGGIIPTESAGTDVTFDIFNAVVRAQLVAQFRAADPENKIIPFVLAGAGAMRVVDIGTTETSLFKKDTAAHGTIGFGAKYRSGGGWGVRLDARVYLVGDNAGDPVTEDFEILASLYRNFGAQEKVAKKVEPPKVEADADADGVTGEADKCPQEAEDKDGFQDEDGCPDADNDQDGIGDATDKCGAEPEDKDNFQDEDGCPDPDNDQDGVPDAADKCAEQPETVNGIDDEDGCPDEVPANLSAILGPVAGVSFRVNSADLLPASKKALDKVATALAEFPTVTIEVQAHTDDQTLKAGGKFADNDALSQARADAVKAYLVTKGLAEDHLVAKGYAATVPLQDPTGLKGAKLRAARKANQRVELKLVTPAAPAAQTAPATEAPATDAPATETPAPAPAPAPGE